MGNYLLQTYATDEVIADKETVQMQFQRTERTLASRSADVLCEKRLKS